MKFLAILKDSVRETIDAKVFYVMVGLSLLLTVLALSVSFTPVPGAQQIVRHSAALALSSDTTDLNSAQTFDVLFRARPVQFTVNSVAPLDGEPDAPGSRFKVVLTAQFNTPEAA